MNQPKKDVHGNAESPSPPAPVANQEQAGCMGQFVLVVIVAVVFGVVFFAGFIYFVFGGMAKWW